MIFFVVKWKFSMFAVINITRLSHVLVLLSPVFFFFFFCFSFFSSMFQFFFWNFLFMFRIFLYFCYFFPFSFSHYALKRAMLVNRIWRSNVDAEKLYQSKWANSPFLCSDTTLSWISVSVNVGCLYVSGVVCLRNSLFFRRKCGTSTMTRRYESDKEKKRHSHTDHKITWI